MIEIAIRIDFTDFKYGQLFGHLPRPLHRRRRDKCPSHDIFSRAVVPMRWSPPTWAASLLSYHSFYIAYAGKKLKKAENNEQTFFWTNNYLKRTIVRYGLSPLARTLISFMSSWIFFTLPTRRSRQKRASSRPKIPRTYRDQRFPFRSSLSLFFIMPLPSCFLLIVACTDQRKHGEKAHEKQGLYASQGHDLSYFQF